MIPLELASGLDTLPCRGDFDEDTLLLNTDGVVECNELLGLGDGARLVEGKTSVDLSRDTARDKSKDLLAELDELFGKANRVYTCNKLEQTMHYSRDGQWQGWPAPQGR